MEAAASSVRAERSRSAQASASRREVSISNFRTKPNATKPMAARAQGK